MGKDTHIQWCDDSNNIQMGCEGCELVKGLQKPKCYAKVMTDRYAGLKGWPEKFEVPKIFMERIPKMINWPDLTGKDRPENPWLNGLSRLIFLNDMGDTFSNGMPKDWFKDVLPFIEKSPHQYLVLSKWPNRFQRFNAAFPIPDNIWPGTTITMQKTVFRAKFLTFGKVRWVSIEPIWEKIDLSSIIENLNWVIVGGESGIDPTDCKIEFIENVIEQCTAAGVPVFVKQLGTVLAKKMNLKDFSGGNWEEWPDHLRYRQMPIL